MAKRSKHPDALGWPVSVGSIVTLTNKLQRALRERDEAIELGLKCMRQRDILVREVGEARAVELFGGDA